MALSQFLVVATILAALAARIDHPLGMVALGVCLLLVAKFAWMAFGWSYQKVEAVIFQRSAGDEAFVIFTDKPGDPEFTDFVQRLRSSIADSAKKEAQPDGRTIPGLHPSVSELKH